MRIIPDQYIDLTDTMRPNNPPPPHSPRSHLLLTLSTCSSLSVGPHTDKERILTHRDKVAVARPLSQTTLVFRIDQ